MTFFVNTVDQSNEIIILKANQTKLLDRLSGLNYCVKKIMPPKNSSL